LGVTVVVCCEVVEVLLLAVELRYAFANLTA
jgi:hypothetical protein